MRRRAPELVDRAHVEAAHAPGEDFHAHAVQRRRSRHRNRPRLEHVPARLVQHELHLRPAEYRTRRNLFWIFLEGSHPDSAAHEIGKCGARRQAARTPSPSRPASNRSNTTMLHPLGRTSRPRCRRAASRSTTDTTLDRPLTATVRLATAATPSWISAATTLRREERCSERLVRIRRACCPRSWREQRRACQRRRARPSSKAGRCRHRCPERGLRLDGQSGQKSNNAVAASHRR